MTSKPKPIPEPRVRRAVRALRACLLVLLPPAAAAAPLDPAWLAQVERMAGEAARQAFGARTPTRVEVSAGPLDARLRLAPCGRIEIYWPSGHRPWGRTRVGLRCAQGPVAWNVTAPLTVQVWAPALVTTQPLPAGTLLEERHLRIGETDWAERDAPVLLSAEELLGRALARPIAAGSAVRADDLKRRQWFAAGDHVRLQAVGPGFSVGGEGTAITPGIEGQTVRVRTESGRVVSGTAVGDRRVELRL